MNYNLLFPSPAKRLLEEQLSNYIRRHLEEKRKRQRAVCIQNVEGLRLVHHLPDPWSSSEPATGCCLLSLRETATSALWKAVTRQTSVTPLWMTLFPSLLQGTISLPQTWQDLQEQHPVCWLLFLLIHLSDASPLMKGVSFGWGRDPLAQTGFCSSAKLPHFQGRSQTSAQLCSSCFLVLLWSLQGPALCQTAEPRGRERGSKLQIASIRLCPSLPDRVHLKARSVFALAQSKHESVTSVWKRNLSSAPALPLAHRCLTQKCCFMRETTGGRLNQKERCWSVLQWY